ncbi:uncharacterized protein BKCO1_1000572 [Diplodia corticola]|uniref:Uncharacterized protein n=1 Tax=Diplodia corticola TaxID=236234 RepID=A0A1J9SIX6_9PEZI|nr:uncharacterized protein BKCO1_1000572 [Diplodia corticola]OJD40311.1 hypothetical protein BKCO1_1000572 [Diplodia corticola]
MPPATTISAPAVVPARASCVLPNGTDRNPISNTTSSPATTPHLPCTTSSSSAHDDDDHEASMWCNPDTTATTTSRLDGLCQAGSCTDRTWQAKRCVQLCVDGESMGGDAHVVLLTQCADRSFCCDRDGSGERCCEEAGRGRWVGVGEGGVVVDATTAVADPDRAVLARAAERTAVAPAGETGATPAPSDAAGDSSSSNAGLIAGGVVGCVVGGLVIAAGICVLMRLRSGSRSHGPRVSTDDVPMSPEGPAATVHKAARPGRK